jgi:hypothetical protein
METIVLSILMLAALVSNALVADTPIAFKDLPPIVQKTMLKEATAQQLKTPWIEVENGKTYYECETILNGKTRNFLVNPRSKTSWHWMKSHL